MDQFLQSVQQAMVAKGWGAASAHAEIQYDPDYLQELRNEGMSANDVAAEVIRAANARQGRGLDSPTTKNERSPDILTSL